MDRVLGFLRQGMNLGQACKAADIGRDAVYRRRKKDYRYDAAVKQLMKGVKPLAHQHITLVSKKQTMTPERQEWWEKWDDAAAAGTLAKRFPLKEAA